MLLSYGKTATASSCECPEKDASHAVDENVQTWWKADREDKAPWLLVHLGQCRRVHAVQINFADGMREIFHLETTFFGFCGGKSGKISVGDGENHCLRMMIFLLM